MAQGIRATHLQTVKIGLMNDDRAQIASGLTGEDRVVARPPRDVVSDMRVAITER